MTIATVRDLAPFCVPMNIVDELVVVFPGGAALAAMDGYETGDALAVVKSMLGQLNAAMVPLKPFFDILDFAKSAFDCIDAIPDMITGNPFAFVEAVAGLTKAVGKLLVLIPPLPIFVLVKGVLRVIIMGLTGMLAKLRALIKHSVRITDAATKAAATGNVGLAAVVSCATSSFDAQLVNMNRDLAPLNRLIGVLNVLLELAGFDCIPAVGDIADVSDDSLDPIQAFIDLLTLIANLIPVELPQLPAAQAGQCI